MLRKNLWCFRSARVNQYNDAQTCLPTGRDQTRKTSSLMTPFRRGLYLAAISFSAIFLSGGTVRAQQREKPEAPEAKPPGPPEQNLRVIAAQAPYEPISGKQRIEWAALQTFGPESLMVGVWTAGLGTARNKPFEYGPHWEGFGKRYAMRFSGVAASNTIEAGLGALWGEDPRYVRNGNLPFKKRIGNVLLYSFASRNREGKLMPAYARYIAIPGNNFLANTWRVSSEATTSDALARTGYGVLAEISGNAWNEFWPDVRRKVFRK